MSAGLKLSFWVIIVSSLLNTSVQAREIFSKRIGKNLRGPSLPDRNVQSITIIDTNLKQQFLFETFAGLLIQRILEKNQEQLGIIPEKEARFPVLPPTITIPISDSRIDFDNIMIEGFYEHFNSAFEFAIQDDLRVELHNETVSTLEYSLRADEITLRGNYSMNLRLNFTYLDEIIPDFPIEIPEEPLIVPIEGRAGYEITLRNSSLMVKAELNHNTSGGIETVRTSIENISTQIALHFDNILFNGLEAEFLLDIISELLNSGVIDLYFSLIQPELEKVFDATLTELLKDCLVADLINDDLSCTGFFPTAEPPSTTTTTPTATWPTTTTPTATWSTTTPTATWPTTTPTATWPTTTTPTATWPTTTWPTTTDDPYPYECSISKPCPAGTYCEVESFGSYCVCIDQLYSVRTYRREAPCLRIVGASCRLANNHPDYVGCVDHSICAASNSTHGRCECQTGFLGDERGTCAADFGQRCGPHIQVECSEDFSLACRVGICACASPDLIFESGRGCVAPVGEPCNVHSDIEHPHRVQCASRLECVQLRAGRHLCQPAIESDPTTTTGSTTARSGAWRAVTHSSIFLLSLYVKSLYFY